MGITASTSPCHECEPKSHEHRLRTHLPLRSRYHILVLICHITCTCMHDGLFTYIVALRPPSYTSIRHFLSASFRLLFTYLHMIYSRLIVVAHLHPGEPTFFYPCLVTGFFKFLDSCSFLAPVSILIYSLGS